MTIGEVEKEFGEPLDKLVAYFNDPNNDYMGYGFGLRDIAGILGIHVETLSIWAKKLKIKIKKPRQFSRFDDICYVYRNGLLLQQVINREIRYKTIDEISRGLGMNSKHLQDIVAKYGLQHLNLYSSGRQPQKRKV